MIKCDTIGGMFGLAIGLFVLVASLKLGLGELSEPGAGFVPFCAGVLFIGATALMMIRSRWGSRETAVTPTPGVGMRWRTVLAVVAGGIVYLLLMERLGYLVATFGLMLLLFGLSRDRLWVVLVWAASTVLGSYLLIHILLKVPLPRGILSF
jgi:putative tricarboxylic transport membrane protein